MRRSAAPSKQGQGPAPKKQFIVPRQTSCSKQPSNTIESVINNTVSTSSVSASRSARDIVRLIASGPNEVDKGVDSADDKSHASQNDLGSCLSPPSQGLAKTETSTSTSSINPVSSNQSSNFNGLQRFKSRPQLFEAIKANVAVTNTRCDQSSTVEEPSSVNLNDNAPAKYFSVMWCKLSKKKHKKWEGDAILIARQRSVILIDMEGKEIGRSTGYKTSELETLTDGQMLVIGGKEIEVMGVLTEEQFKSGKCFQSASGDSSVVDLSENSTSLPRPVPGPITPSFLVNGNRLLH